MRNKSGRVAKQRRAKKTAAVGRFVSDWGRKKKRPHGAERKRKKARTTAVAFFSGILRAHRTRNVFLSATFAVAVILLWRVIFTGAVSANLTLTSQSDWEVGEYYTRTVDTKSTAGSMKVQSGFVGAWNAGTPGFFTDIAGYDYWTYDGASYGADFTTDGTYIYLIVGNRRPYLIRYNPETNTWRQLASAPTAFFYGGSITYDASTKAIFAIDGGEGVETGSSGKRMYKYDIATDAWSRVSDAPDTWGLGSSIAADGSGRIYAVRGRSTDTLWKYTIATDAWDVTLPAMPAPYYVFTTNGQPLEFVNESYGSSCTQGCLYALYGNGNRQFFRYDIAEQQWYYNTPTDITIPAALGGVGYGSSMAYDSVNGNLYLLHGNQTDNFSKYDVSTETWDAAEVTTPDAPGVAYNGGALVYLNGYFYAFKGYGVPDVWRYDIANTRWDSISTPAATGNAGEDGHMVFVPNGAQCADSSGCLFTLRGANTNTFWRYDINSKSWNTSLSTTNLGTLQAGSSMCWNGADYLYVLRANNTLNFYRYSISGNAWTAQTDMPGDHSGPNDYPTGAANAQYGGSVTCLGTTTYALKGATGVNGANHFFSWNGTTWSHLPVLPQRAYIGAALTNVPNGGECADATGCIFALAGNLRGDFFRYDASAAAWTTLKSLPVATWYTASLSYDGAGNIYAISGDYDQRMWRYDISSDTWTRVADLPARVGYNNALAYDSGSSTMYVLGGMATYNIWKFTPSANDYISSSTWISATQDLNYVSAWEQLTANHPTPGTSSVSIAMRSSTDKVTWSSWETVVNGATGDSTTQSLSAATTPARRYIQLRVTLTSDGSNTPTFQDATVTYTKDSTAPTNPSATGYSDSGQATGITSGNSYYYVTPYFSLSGASDAHSGVLGYYVALTTNASLDPSSSEDYYQTGATYEVNSPLTGGSTYYLRIATKDRAGNISSPTSAFTYVYSGITNASSQTWTVQADFEASGTSETNINTAAGSGTAMTLDSVSNGTWMDLPATFGLAANATAYNDTAMAWDGNNTIYVLRSINTQTFFKYTISTKTWTALANTGANAQYGSSIVYVPDGVTTGCTDDGGCIFATMGGAGTGFRRYDVNANAWSGLTAVTGTVGYGAGLVWNGADFIFATRGAGNTDFYRYNIASNIWTSRATPDYGINYGGTLAFVPNGSYCSDASGCIFATRGGGSNHFWRYDIGSNSWTYKTAPPTASPSKTNYGATMVYNGGYLYYMAGYASTDFLRYDITNDLWSTLADLSATHYYGSAQGMVFDTTTSTIYMFRGYNEYTFFSYDVTNNQWRNPTMPQGNSSNGFYYGGVAYDGTDTLYIARGNNLTDFYKYTISTQTWQRMADIPMRMNTGSDLVYVSGTVYALTGAPPYGEAATRFYSYNPTSDTWAQLASTPNTVSYGATLVWDGSNTIYTARGNNTTTYYSYSISGNAWSTQASVLPGAVYEGGCAVRGDGVYSGYIYQIRASNTRNIYRCTLDTGAGTCTWSAAGTLADAPASPGNLQYGNSCTVSNSKIFVPRGNTNNTDFLVYDIAGNSWTNRSTNAFFYYGRLLTGPNDILYGFRGYNTSGMERYVQATASTGFERTGTWTSQIIDSSSVLDYSGVAINVTLPSNTAIKLETRSCSVAACANDPNHASWLAWDEASNLRTLSGTRYYTIDSTAASYTQLRVTLTSDRIFTPTVNDIALRWYTDGTAPSNPDTLTALSQSGGTAITSGNWYNYAGPYFSWSGASDNAGGIGIQGYYVYFGTNTNADPATVGSLQSGTTYTASNLQTGQTYYLRIKTRDYKGNVSGTAWAPFTYSYDNVAPSRPTNLQANPAVPSSTNSFSFSWTAASDSGGSPSFQYCYKRYFSDANQDASDTCIASSNTTLSNIEALAEGTNYLRIRSKDAAGNYSNSGEYESVAYRWAQTPPTLPQSVAHGAVVNDPYQHTFSWNAPAQSAFDITAYCFQVNAQPTAAYCNNGTYGRWTTTGETASRFLAAFATPNTQPGTNNFYIVAKDEAGNVNWSPTYNCATGLGCISFSSTTVSPNPPQNLSITDASDRAAGTYRLTLGWRKPADNPGSQLYKFNIYRSTDGTNFTLRESPLYVTGQSDYAFTDVALSNLVTYSYYVKAVDSAGAESAATLTVSKKPEGKFTTPPNLVGNPSIQPRIRSAVIQWLTDDPTTHAASSFVQYGTTTSYGSEQGSSELTGTHAVTLVDLQPATKYEFRLKWVDQDGNIGYSPNYSLTTNDAPSAPTNIKVDPASSSSNRFTFDWDAPADEGVKISGYFYSVNNVPTKDNTDFVTASGVGPIAAASQQGVNTLYVVAVDDMGNVNYDNYASIQFEVYTAAPASPRNVTIVDSSDRDAKRYNITLTWDPPATTSTGEVLTEAHIDEISYTIYRSENGGQHFNDIAEIKSTGYLDTGLDNTKTYTYKVTAADTAGATSESTALVSEVPEGRYTKPPAITEGPNVTPDSFSVLVTWRSERVASSFVVFGEAQDKLTEEQGQAEQVETHSVKVTGLEPETTYYYQVKSIDVDENVALSDVKSFTTLEAPKVSELLVKDVRLHDAMITWKTNKESTTSIMYGTTTNYGASFADLSGSFTTTHTIKLENLADGTLYHARVRSEDRNGNPVVSDDYTFTTLTFPKISDAAAHNKSAGQTEITWKTNVPTTSSVEYYGETIPPKTQGNTALVTDHAVLLYGLEDATLYKFKVRGSDQFGYEAISDENEFTTLEDTTPPEVFGVKSESNTIGSGEASKIQIIVSWKTNEPTTSRVEYGVGLSGSDYTDTTEESAELVMDHLVVIAELSPAKTYHFRVVSRDKAGNETKSSSYSVLTSRKRESFLQLIITNLEDTFSWVENFDKLFQGNR